MDKSNSQGASALNGGSATSPYSWRNGFQTVMPDRASWVHLTGEPLYRA